MPRRGTASARAPTTAPNPESRRTCVSDSRRTATGKTHSGGAAWVRRAWTVSSTSMPRTLQPHTPEPQRIADDAHRGERHGGRGNDRREQNAGYGIERPGRDRHARGVVDEGEEQVLADVAHRRRGEPAGPHDAGRGALEQRHARAFDGDVGTGPHRDA